MAHLAKVRTRRTRLLGQGGLPSSGIQFWPREPLTFHSRCG